MKHLRNSKEDKYIRINFREVVQVIVKELKIGNTTVLVDDEYMYKTEEERQSRYELFNKIGCEIINNSMN